MCGTTNTPGSGPGLAKSQNCTKMKIFSGGLQNRMCRSRLNNTSAHHTGCDVYNKIASIPCHLIKQDWHVDMWCRQKYVVPSHVCGAVTCMWCRHMYVVPSYVCGVVTCMWCRHMYVVPSYVCGAVTCMWCHHMFVVPSHVCEGGKGALSQTWKHLM